MRVLTFIFKNENMTFVNKSLVNMFSVLRRIPFHSGSPVIYCSIRKLRLVRPPPPDATKPGGYPCPLCPLVFDHKFILDVHLMRRHIPVVDQVLKDEPYETYTEIFGVGYKKKSKKELRYPQGLIVRLEGKQKGLWYSFTENKGGGPVRAIQVENDVKLAEATKMAVDLAKGLKLVKSDQFGVLTMPKNANKRETDFLEERRKKVETVEEIWRKTIPLRNSLGFDYLVKHRAIPKETVRRLAFRFLPPGAKYYDYIDEKQVLNSMPAVIVPVENAQGQLTGVQRIYLNRETGARPDPGVPHKFSKGIIQEAAGIVQRRWEYESDKKHILYIVEGPETGASIAAAAGPEVTVLAALSVSNYEGMFDVILAQKPDVVILAADNDEEGMAKTMTLKSFKTMKRKFRKHGIEMDLILPQLKILPSSFLNPHVKKTGVDWNDVIKINGLNDLRKQLGLN